MLIIRRWPLIFNDYMNCLMGDPTTEKLLPVIDAAAEAGAEYFVIDAGWYADDGNWWDTVGAWEPSVKRFPDGGLDAVIDHIKERGLVPGLWVEPEVVGVHSPMLGELPDEAYFSVAGKRIEENGRYQLDFRHPAVIERMDRIIDGLIARFDLGYFKFDYNINPGHGTDVGGVSRGDGSPWPQPGLPRVGSTACSTATRGWSWRTAARVAAGWSTASSEPSRWSRPPTRWIRCATPPSPPPCRRQRPPSSRPPGRIPSRTGATRRTRSRW